MSLMKTIHNNALAPLDTSKKVSVIIPIYNAEKFLGYCLNSVLSQTYTNWEAILVNDGSLDDSLSICESYAALDSRFNVISIPNGGVSNARNVGLDHATGDYLHFLDSDDMIAAETLERQVAAAQQYNKNLVVHDVLMVDFTNPENIGARLNGSWLQEKPAVLDAEGFREKRMRLIWFTALLEGLYGKLYSRELWESLGLRFPRDISLGEDFVTNMKYYAACNGVVFLNQIGHYYNNIIGSQSLTHKYRPDLFENKMYLMEELRTHLQENNCTDEEEWAAFYNYAASSGLRCVAEIVNLENVLSRSEKVKRLEQLYSHELFVESVEKAPYIDPNYQEYVADIRRKNGKELHEEKPEAVTMNTPVSVVMSVSAPAAKKYTLINRVVRKCMRIVRPMFGDSAMGERITRWEQEFALHGLKHTIRMHKQAHKKVNCFIFTTHINELNEKIAANAHEQNQKIVQASFQLKQGFNRASSQMKEELQQANSQLKEELQQASSQMKEELQQESSQLKQKLQQESAQLKQELQKDIRENEETVRREISAAARTVNDYSWLSEQRMMRVHYLNEVNELRQKKKAIMIATAEHANIGDSAITLAEQFILQEQFPEYFQVEISTYEFAQKEEFLHAIMNPEDIIFVNGGGNMGDKYLAEEELHRAIVEEFPNNKIVIFPQTISFSDSDSGKQELEHSAYVYNHHPDLTLFVRGEESLSFAKEHFSNVKTYLMPDVVHVLRTNYALRRNGVLLCLREDEEGLLNQERKELIHASAGKVSDEIEQVTNIADRDVTRDIRGYIVRKELKRFASRQVVVTDRLHGMIFAAVTGTPCVVISSYNHKIKEYYEAFFADSNAIFFIGNDLEKLDDALQQAMKVDLPVYSVFERNPHGKIRELCGN